MRANKVSQFSWVVSTVWILCNGFSGSLAHAGANKIILTGKISDRLELKSSSIFRYTQGSDFWGCKVNPWINPPHLGPRIPAPFGSHVTENQVKDISDGLFRAKIALKSSKKFWCAPELETIFVFVQLEPEEPGKDQPTETFVMIEIKTGPGWEQLPELSNVAKVQCRKSPAFECTLIDNAGQEEQKYSNSLFIKLGNPEILSQNPKLIEFSLEPSRE